MKNGISAASNIYACKACGASFNQREAFCLSCRRWDTIEIITSNNVLPFRKSNFTRKVKGRSKPITEVSEKEDLQRFSTGTPALDKVMGGGMVPGSTSLVSGEPGIGKSTLLLRVAADMAESGRTVLYATAEEEEIEIFRRAGRIDAVREGLQLLATKRFSDVESEIKRVKPDLLIIDSLSAMVTSNDGEAGSVSEIKRLTSKVDELVTRSGGQVAIFIVAHVNKDLAIAGPQSMQHMFDATFFLESTGNLQTLRSLKNRYGKLDSALFEMTSRGLEAVNNPSERFLSDRVPDRPGSVVSALCDTDSRIARTTLFEIQALVGEPKPRSPRKLSSNGIDKERLAQTIDVLDKSCIEFDPENKKLLLTRDVRVNVPGGIPIRDPSVDLALALAIASSTLNQPLDETMVAFGEIGLAGEIRSVPRSEPRIDEAINMGFTKAIVPRGSAHSNLPKKFECFEVTTLAEALSVAFSYQSNEPKIKKTTRKSNRRVK